MESVLSLILGNVPTAAAVFFLWKEIRDLKESSNVRLTAAEVKITHLEKRTCPHV